MLIRLAPALVSQRAKPLPAVSTTESGAVGGANPALTSACRVDSGLPPKDPFFGLQRGAE